MLQAPFSPHLPEKPILHGHHITKRHPHIKNTAANSTDNLQVSEIAFTQRSCSREVLNVGPGWWNVINQRIMDRKVGGC